ncbi:MAG: oligosaccharide flippase family protein [Bacteroidales bacterium]|nr:oligosaccharide flippase family protein [Bacteroidales bacterium]
MKPDFLSSEIVRIKNSEFVRNSAALLTANALSQGIAIAVYPLVTRLYAPSDVGSFSLFLSIVSVLSIIATGRYEAAVVLPPEKEKASALFQLCLIINLLLFVVLLPITIFFQHPVAMLFEDEGLERVLPLLPFLLLVTGVWQALNYLLIREKRFKNISGYNLGQSIVNSAGKVFFGFVKVLQSGLVYATLIGQLVALSGSVLVAWKAIKSFLHIDFQKIKSVAKEYANFPKFEMPHAMVNAFSGNLPILILSAYFGMEEIGFFSLGITLGFRPISLFSSSMEQVLYKKVADGVQQNQSIKHFLSEFCKKISWLVLPCFVILFFIVEWLCGVLFGAQWEIAGFYTKLLLPWFFFVLLTGSLSFIPKVFFKQKNAMLIEFGYILLRIIALCIGVAANDFVLAVALYGFVSAVVIALQLLWYFSLVNKYERARG